MVMSLDNTGDKGVQELVSEIADKWMTTNYVEFKSHNIMLEKVNLNC